MPSSGFNLKMLLDIASCIAVPSAIAAVCFAVISHVHALSQAAVPLWAWFVPWNLTCSNAAFVTAGVFGVVGAVTRRSRVLAMAVLGSVVTIAHLLVILMVTRIPASGSWFDLRVAALVQTTVVVFEVTVLVAVGNAALLARDWKERCLKS